jgi:hypothetical protein
MKRMAPTRENGHQTEGAEARRCRAGFSRSRSRHAFLVNWALQRAHRQRHRLEGAVEQLFLHLLKTKHQPHLAGASWDISIAKQRRQIAKITKQSPSLKPLLSDAEFLEDAYGDAVLDAMQGTGLPKATFPATCLFGPDDGARAESSSMPRAENAERSAL